MRRIFKIAIEEGGYVDNGDGTIDIVQNQGIELLEVTSNPLFTLAADFENVAFDTESIKLYAGTIVKLMACGLSNEGMSIFRHKGRDFYMPNYLAILKSGNLGIDAND